MEKKENKVLFTKVIPVICMLLILSLIACSLYINKLQSDCKQYQKTLDTMNYETIRLNKEISQYKKELGITEITTETASETTTEATTETTTEAPTQVQTYEEGQYKVGVDIPAGSYIVYSKLNTLSYYEITADANGNNIIENENFKNQHYVNISDGQYFSFTNGYVVPVSSIRPYNPSNGQYDEGQYKVGYDIPAGEYKVTHKDGFRGYYAITSTPGDNDIIANDNFNGDCYVNITNGQYLYLNNCYIKN